MTRPLAKPLFVCDDVVRDPASGKISVLNIFNFINTPGVLKKMNVFCCWRDGQGRVKTRIDVLRAGLDDWELVYRSDNQFLEFDDPLQTRYSVYRLQQLELAGGFYVVELYADEEFVDDWPLKVDVKV